MTTGRIQAISILGSLGLLIVFSAGRAFSQTRPGINAFVNAPEGCSYVDPIDPNDLYAFTRTQIQALSLARAGEHGSLHIQTSPTSSNPSSNPMSDKFVGLREERIGNTCAGFILSPYTKSDNRKAASAAKQLVAAYQELGRMADERLGIELQQSIRTSYGTPIKTRLADMKNRRQTIMRSMNDALTTSLSLLIDQNQTDFEGKQGRIILTHEQRLSLRDFLQSQFPSLLMNEKNGTEPSDDFTRQAALIRSFLTGSTASVSK